ncbi:hypothetical protein FFK22_039855 [Mycobacterium sp. KBS0706]|uniref:hypothetical protein n=1 Tax=Mycobacterium sp. KBS0706 TaxID=2578109 RepID=UPI00110FB5EC|nr:hypothetical protein [Mycobacterium sp. KBS0706]TSD83036.1 hypothetical protein FFK22_039855 [Mycobacterium sp. KBS0706]
MSTDYFLEQLASENESRKALSELLPGQTDPWILWCGEDDVLAFFDFNAFSEHPVCICARVSGRHYGEDEPVLAVLRQLQQRIGGVIEDDYGNVL